MDQKIYLRLVEDKDMKLLFDWRNDEVVRKNSFSTEPIDWQEHVHWFNSTLKNPSVLFFIMMNGEQTVGQIRIVLEKDDVGIIYCSIAREFRGLGYSSYILNLAENEIYERFSDRYTLKALVKENNIASQLMLEKLNYQIQNNDINDYKIYVKIPEIKKAIYVCPPPGGIMFLTNNKNTLILYDWLQINENSYCYSEPISIDLIRNLKPKMIISYNYQYLIDSECIEMMKNRIINLHISLLPWNKGSNPNFWSFIDDTPKGVSIHIISPKLDQGDIIVQEKINFDENLETLRSSYEKLNVLIQRLFKDNWTIIRDNNYVLFKQEGNGSYHNKNDYLQYLSGKKIDFDENIVSLKARISKNGAV